MQPPSFIHSVTDAAKCHYKQLPGGEQIKVQDSARRKSPKMHKVTDRYDFGANQPRAALAQSGPLLDVIMPAHTREEAERLWSLRA